MATFRATRSSDNPDVDYPPFDPGEWRGSGHLPIWAEAIGAVRFMVNKKVSAKEATQKVATILVDHWTKRNVYTKTPQNVQKKLESQYKEFLLIRKIFLKGKPSKSGLERYLSLKGEKDKVFDISTEDKDRIRVLEGDIGIRMSKTEYDYLRSQVDSSVSRSDVKKILCFAKTSDPDPVWVEQERRKEKLKKYEDKKRLEAKELLDLETLSEDAGFTSTEDVDDVDSTHEVVENTILEEKCDINKKKTNKRSFVINEDNQDPLPATYRHVRDSERKVKDSIYLAITDLIGIGLSIQEAQKAVKIVSNRVFAREFKLAGEDDVDDELSPIDLDTLPNERSIRKMTEQVETHGLAAEAQEILDRRSEGNNVFTHAADSTTKKGVGKFMFLEFISTEMSCFLSQPYL